MGINKLRKLGRQGSILVLVVGFIVAGLLHHVAAYHFPTPWPDEAAFLIPAIHFSEELSLAAPELNAPRGIFWMPDGYYVFMGLLFKVLPASLATARLVSFFLVLVFAVSLYVAGWRLGVPPLVIAIALSMWLITPRVVMMSNVARMEALVLAVIGIALMLVVHRYWIAGLAIASLSALVHPVGLVMLLCFVGVAAVFWKSMQLRTSFGSHIFNRSPMQHVVVGTVALAWIVEALHFSLNLDLASTHMAYQFLRKANRSLGIGMQDLLLLSIAGTGVLVCYLQKERENMVAIALLFTLVGGLDVVQVLGQEMWYEVYRSEVAGLLVVMGLSVLARDMVAARYFKAKKAVTIGVGVIVGFTVSLGLVYGMSNRSQIRHFSAFGMGIRDCERNEWSNFVRRAQAELENLDMQLDEPAWVLIDASSAMSLFLMNRSWSYLRFIQWTGATPLDENVSVDYLLFSLHKPDWCKELVKACFPSTDKFTEISRIVSAHRTFELVIFQRKRRAPSLRTVPQSR